MRREPLRPPAESWGECLGVTSKVLKVLKMLNIRGAGRVSTFTVLAGTGWSIQNQSSLATSYVRVLAEGFHDLERHWPQEQHQHGRQREPDEHGHHLDRRLARSRLRGLTATGAHHVTEGAQGLSQTHADLVGMDNRRAGDAERFGLAAVGQRD